MAMAGCNRRRECKTCGGRTSLRILCHGWGRRERFFKCCLIGRGLHGAFSIMNWRGSTNSDAMARIRGLKMTSVVNGVRITYWKMALALIFGDACCFVVSIMLGTWSTTSYLAIPHHGRACSASPFRRRSGGSTHLGEFAWCKYSGS